MIEAVVGVALRAVLASVVLGGALALCVLAATRTLALTASTRHALWTTALVAMGIMPLAGIGMSLARAEQAQTAVARPPAIPLSAFHPVQSPAWTATPSTDAAPTVPGYRAKEAPSAAGGVAFARNAVASWTPRLSPTLALGAVAVWAAGALIGLIGLAGSIARVRGLKRRSSPLDGTLAGELPWLTEVGPGREIYLRLSYETETPVAIGFGRPVILVPTELATGEGLSAIESLILHEHAHLRRYDDWTNLVQRVIERIFWFNPIVWIVGRRIALEREIASDDAVVEKTGEAHQYATSLWKLAREMRMPEHAVVAPGALLTRKQISVRIEQLLDAKRARLHRSPAAAFGVSLVALAAVGIVATSAPAVELPAAPVTLAARTDEPLDVAAWQAIAGNAARGFAETDVRASVPSGVRAKQNAAPVRKTVRDTGTAAGTNRVETANRARHDERRTVYERVVVTRRGASNANVAQREAKHAVAGAAAAGRPVTERDVTASEAGAVAGIPGAVADGAIDGAVPSPPAAPQANMQPARPPSGAKRIVAFHLPELPNVPAIPSGSFRDAATMGRPQFSAELRRAMHAAMVTLPVQIAQARSAFRQRNVRLDGTKVTREIVGACTACSMQNADLRGVDLHGLRIDADDFTGADMRNVNLAGARLSGVSLARANLTGADLRGAFLAGVVLDGTILENAVLDDVKLTGVSLRGLALRGVSLRSLIANCMGCDFNGMELRGADLHGITLSGADLGRADLRGANLRGVHFFGVGLAGAKLDGADLTNARFEGCDLAGVSLRSATTTGMTSVGSGLDG